MSLKTDQAIHPMDMNAAGREIKELKKYSERKMIKSREPKRLWGDASSLNHLLD